MATSAAPAQEPEKIWHEATCHCKAVQYRCRLPPLDRYEVCRCNCSICLKLGYLLVYPLREDVEWISGYDTLKSYQMGPKIQEHKFCPGCGSSIGIDSKGMGKRDVWRMNVRLFKGIDLDKLKYWECDGKNEVFPEFPYEE